MPWTQLPDIAHMHSALCIALIAHVCSSYLPGDLQSQQPNFPMLCQYKDALVSPSAGRILTGASGMHTAGTPTGYHYSEAVSS